MLIFIDTNIFFHNWQLRNPDFTYLFNFIENEECTLMMSEIVISEVESTRKNELGAALSLINKNIKSVNNWCEFPVEINLSTASRKYDFKELLESSLDTDFIRYVDFAEISQKEVVERALQRKRPFRENEKGYRDTLIWLSFLNYLLNNGITDEVAFITENVDDFLNSKRTDFHDDLKADIDRLGINCKITFHNSLYNFIKETFKKEDHIVSNNELDKIEDDIEERTIDAINNWTTEELKRRLADRWPNISAFLSIEEHEFLIDEGLEDSEIIQSEHIKGRVAYLTCRYNFRICTIKITISKEEFDQKKSLLHYYNEEEVNSEYVSIELYARIYFEVSLQYNTGDKFIEALTVHVTRFK